eukprot:gene1388-1728_t
MLDSLKDTLVITAVGGGAFVIPYLTVYATYSTPMRWLISCRRWVGGLGVVVVVVVSEMAVQQQQ